MANLEPKSVKSKSGSGVVIRSAKVTDAEQIVKLSKAVAEEEIYELISGKEFNRSVDTDQKWIESHEANPNHIIIIAEVNSKVIAVLDFANGHRQRIAHVGDAGISIAKDFRDQGIGSLLMKALIEWAKDNSAIEKIGLQVHSSNDRAIGMYKKMGFEIEGVRKRDLKYNDGHYVDTVVMGLFV